MATGIYRIKNLINGYLYVEGSVNLERRRAEHFNMLQKNKHSNINMQSAFNLYGEGNFIFDILEYCEPKDLVKREQYYIDLFQPEYNICSIVNKSLQKTRNPKINYTEWYKLFYKIMYEPFPKTIKMLSNGIIYESD